MELKRVSLRLLTSSVASLNRTILELKLDNTADLFEALLYSLNRTILELKQINLIRRCVYNFALNRTILELKRGWLGKKYRSAANFKSYHFGIETQNLTRQ